MTDTEFQFHAAYVPLDLNNDPNIDYENSEIIYVQNIKPPVISDNE
jgi:hypothetical protein